MRGALQMSGVCESPKKPEKTAQLGGSSLSSCESGRKDQTLEPAVKRSHWTFDLDCVTLVGMPWEVVYASVRGEITTNHVLMHVVTLAVAVILIAGVWVVEARPTVLSVLLPFLSLAWAAAILRFDYFIHRQGAYLRALESHLTATGTSYPLWEIWKGSRRSTMFVLPALDFVGCTVIVIPTLYLLLGPAREYFKAHQWPGASAFAYSMTILLIGLLAILGIIPTLAAM